LRMRGTGLAGGETRAESFAQVFSPTRDALRRVRFGAYAPGGLRSGRYEQFLTAANQSWVLGSFGEASARRERGRLTPRWRMGAGAVGDTAAIRISGSERVFGRRLRATGA
jgi:hypothetical protein